MNLITKWQYFSYWLSQLTAWFKRLPCTITDGKAKDAIQYNLYGNSKQEYIAIDDVQYKIPDGYTLLDSLTATGTQYIDLGLKGSNNTRAVLKLSVISSSTCMMFGSREAATSNAFAIWAASSTAASQLRIGWDSSSGYTGSIWEVDKEYSFDISADGYYIDGSLVYSPASATFQTPNNLKLFAYDTDGTLTYSAGTFYGVQKIYESNVLVRAVAPMKNSSDVLGMYDFVNSVFYTNAGTGSFTAGSEAPTPATPVEIQSCGDKNYDIPYETYTPVEYIESDGNQYIDTGVYWTNNHIIETEFKTFSSPTDTNLFGSRGNSPDITCWVNTSSGKGIAMHLPTSSTGMQDTGFVYTEDIINNYATLKTGNTVGVIVNGTQVYKPVSATDYASTITFALFCKHEGSTYNLFGKFIVRYVKIYDGSTLVRNFIPCYRNSDSKPGLFDTVTQTFFTNAKTSATTDFTYGNDRTDLYKIPVVAGSNCGCVDLGSLDWAYYSAGNYFYFNLTDKANGIINLYLHSDKYVLSNIASATAMENMSYKGHASANQIYIKDYSFGADATAFKQAMSGVYLYYQRVDDTSFTQPTTTNIYLDEPLRKVGNYIDKIHFGTGKNLFDSSKSYYGQNKFWNAGSGELIGSTTYYASPKIPVKPNTQYVRTDTSTSANLFFDSTGTYLSTDYTRASITTPSNAYYVAFNIPVATSPDTIQLEQGSTATEYHPYSDTPQVIRNVGYTDLGSLTWVKSSSPQRFEATTTIPSSSEMQTEGKGYCTIYKVLPISLVSSTDNSLYVSSTQLVRTYDSTNYSKTAEEYKEFVTGQYIEYPLATPTSEVISLPTLTPSEGTTIYTVPTKVQPFVSVNLFDKDNTELSGGTLTGTTFTSTATAMNVDYQIPAGTYTISCSNSDTIYLRNGKVSSGIIVQKTSSESSKTFTFTGSVDGYLRISAFNIGTTVSNIQIQEGSSATTYEPYCNGMELEAYVTGRS